MNKELSIGLVLLSIVLLGCGPQVQLKEDYTAGEPVEQVENITVQPQTAVENQTVVETEPEKEPEVKELPPVEVLEYKGKKLDSIRDVRDLSILGPQYVNMSEYKLTVSGLVDEEKSYTYDEVLDMQAYSKVSALYCVTGWDATVLWEGVLVSDLLEKSGVKDEATTIVFHAHDGYTSPLPLDDVVDRKMLLAYKINNVTLTPDRGYPFQLVAEDKWGYKWVKWVTEIEVIDDPDYEGTWERNGYSKVGDVDEPKFD